MIRIIHGDCRDVLRSLPDESVHCCVTSPPYYGLRSYLPSDHPLKSLELGLERTLKEYIDSMVEVFREVRRVLRSDGSLWLNIGDSYNAYNGGRGASKSLSAATNDALPSFPTGYGLTAPKLKNKDLMMVPARLALALQEDGWWLRSQLPWIKRSCMPESCNDRPTSAVEYVFGLARSPRYFWDAEAVKQHGAVPAGSRGAKASEARSNTDSVNSRPPEYWEYTGTRNFRNSDLFFESLDGPHGLICDADGNPIALDVNPQPFSGAHFATFPPNLVAPLISASSSEKGCCAQCGTPWVRDIAATGEKNSRDRSQRIDWIEGVTRGGNDSGIRSLSGATYKPQRAPTGGWSISCKCDAPTRPCTVLDMFAGSGTTLLVADRLQRDAIGIELNPADVEMARKRAIDDAGMFAAVAD